MSQTQRYQRETPTRARERQVVREALNEVKFGTPLATFRASITDNFDDMATDRRPYHDLVTGGLIDTVFWDYWWSGYNPDIFDPFIQPGGDDVGRLGAVDLLVPGLYAIRATIDWQTEDFGFAIPGFRSYIGSNYDDGGTEDQYTDVNNEDWQGGWTLNHFRVVWPSFTGAESTVEIVAGQAGAGEPLYIPGGNAGFWAFPPQLTIAYLGGLEGPPDYMNDSFAGATGARP